MKFNFEQVTVFSDKKLLGNPLAVVIQADDLSDDQMMKFARWTNLSETTFITKPQHPSADYAVRIFTAEGELPFAGHPTLGSCYVWQKTAKRTHQEIIIQECKAGLITIKKMNGKLAFKAPPLIKSGEVSNNDYSIILKGLDLTSEEVEQSQWIDNGPGWVGLRLNSVETLLAVNPDYSLLKEYNIGLCALYPSDSDVRLEVRALCCGIASEDPVTGSLNAAIAQWLISQEILPNRYIAQQGQSIARDGKIYVSCDDEGIWIAGDVVDCIHGEVEFD